MYSSPTDWVPETFEPTRRLLVPRASASQTGSHRSTGSSLSALLSTLIPIFVVASVLLVIFLLLRKRLDRVYGPRTYLGVLDKDERTPKQSAGFLGWTKEYRQLTDEFVLGHSSLDNYLFLRLFKIMMMFCFVGCIITWPVLFPVNATDGGGESGLDILSFSNVNSPARYYAHCFIAWIFLGFVMYVITRESLFYAYLRQAYFLSPYVTSLISAKTVLFVDVPEHYRDEENLRHIFPNTRHIWLVCDPEDLEDMIEEREDAANKLETGEIKLIQDYVKKKGSIFNIDEDDRPTHKLKPLIGMKVDTIDWSRSELLRLIPAVAKKQAEKRSRKSAKLSAVFIEFETMRDAQAAFQQVSHQMPFHLTPKDLGMKPEQVIWKNLRKPFWLVKLIAAISTAFVAFLCIFWTIPVAFIGVLTNVNYLTDRLPWLSFINDIPSAILGVVTGLLPVLLLTILMKLVPIICSALARQFEPTMGAVQLKTQSWYFAFEVIQVFLVTTFSSGASAVVTQIVNDPTGAPQLLAKNLPKASNFYISYFVLKGLLTAMLQLLNVMPLIFALFLGKILDKTPKKMYNRYVTLSGIGWGSFYPKYTNLGVIALAYSCIAPLVLGFATVGFGLLYLGFRYNILFTLGTQVDTQGRAYARALQQLTVGIYLSEFCLIGLFVIGSSGSTLSVGPLVLMIIFTLGTVIWHFQVRSALSRHTTTLPSDLLAEEYCRGPVDDDGEKGHVELHDANGNIKKLDSEESSRSAQYQVPRSADPPPPPSGLFGKIKAFIFPSEFASAAVLSKYILSPHLSEPVRPYTSVEREEAYLNPALTAATPVVWLARDQYGLSRREVDDSRSQVGEGLEITDEDAWFDQDAKIQWNERDLKRTPLWEDKPDY
ncbi:hypothetical protein LTR85_005424 [Meristemomyces frigidus]|nr:hypothetical protein LTR85_005424 [Meristemomyces frigidus]